MSRLRYLKQIDVPQVRADYLRPVCFEGHEEKSSQGALK